LPRVKARQETHEHGNPKKPKPEKPKPKESKLEPFYSGSNFSPRDARYEFRQKQYSNNWLSAVNFENRINGSQIKF